MGYIELLQKIEEQEDIIAIEPAKIIELLAVIGAQYQLSRIIAKKSEGIILLVEDKELQRIVVLKIALSAMNKRPARIFHGENPRVYGKAEKKNEDAERFKRGCIIQRYAHENCLHEAMEFGYIPQIYKLEDTPGLYCEMEFIQGETLLDWAKDQREIEKIKLFLKMIYLVEKALHDHSVIHCDLKHDNWLVLPDNRPVLLDFGIAKNKAQKSELTRDNSPPLGSLYYAPKRQLRSPQSRSYKDDIYTMATTLYVLWQGHPPHRHPTFMENRLNEINLMETFPPHVLPQDMEKIFGKAVSFDSPDAYTDIAQFREEFEQVAARWGAKEEKNIAQTVPQADDLSLAQYVDELNKENLPELQNLFERAVWEAMEHKKILKEKYLKGK